MSKRYEYKEQYLNSGYGAEDLLNKRGADGWELCGFIKGYAYLKRELPPETTPTKEVVEREWEIVAVKFKDGRVGSMVSVLNTDEHLKHRLDDWSKYGTSIHSVKRLSDGEVFSIGYEIQYGAVPIGGIPQIVKGIITRFVISQGTAFAEGKPHNWIFPLSNLHKSPPTTPTTLQDQDKFQWDDELVIDCMMAKWSTRSDARLSIETFKASKKHNYIKYQKETTQDYYGGGINQSYKDEIGQYPSQPQNKERIEVTGPWRTGASSFSGTPFNVYRFNSDHIIPDDKLPAIKQSIESIINS